MHLKADRIFDSPCIIKAVRYIKFGCLSESTVETVCLLGNRKYLRKPDATINISLDMKEYYEILDRKAEKGGCENCRQGSTNRRKNRIRNIQKWDGAGSDLYRRGYVTLRCLKQHTNFCKINTYEKKEVCSRC